VGIRPEDFILKPVRHAELLDWLERHLSLSWIENPAKEIAPPQADKLPRVFPPPTLLAALNEVVTLGFYRGIMNQLDEMESAHPRTASFVLEMRDLARQFQFEAMSRILQQAPETPESPHASHPT
jgi:hypothetical protein